MPLDLVSNIVPPLVVTLSFAAMMHITAVHEPHRPRLAIGSPIVAPSSTC
jgi:hypothetical protein